MIDGASAGLPANGTTTARVTTARAAKRRAAASLIGHAVAQAALVGLVVVVVTFLLVRIIPGDPVTAITGSHGTPAARAALRAQLHLNRSLPVQFALYLKQLIHGSLGSSILEQNQSVSGIVSATLPVTLSVVLAASVVSCLGIPIGVMAALTRRRAFDSGIRAGASMMLSTPPFFVGLLLILVFALFWPVLPAGGWPGAWPANLQYLVLPAVALAAYLAPLVVRTVRQAAVDTLHEPWVDAALARGLPVRVLVLRHIVPNTLLPVVTLIGLNAGALIAGAVVVEVVFGLPGIGTELVNAVTQRDYPVIQGIALVSGLIVVVCNLGADLLYRAIDPRTRAQGD